MGLDATLGEEAERGPGVGALPDAEDLDVHASSPWKTGPRPSPPAPGASGAPRQAAALLPARPPRASACRRPARSPPPRLRRPSPPRPARAATARRGALWAARAPAARPSRAGAAWGGRWEGRTPG